MKLSNQSNSNPHCRILLVRAQDCRAVTFGLKLGLGLYHRHAMNHAEPAIHVTERLVGRSRDPGVYPQRISCSKDYVSYLCTCITAVVEFQTRKATRKATFPPQYCRNVFQVS
jgi:hypothetical protein